MPEKRLPVHYTTDDGSNVITPIVDDGGADVHIPRTGTTQVEARPAANYLADDLSNSVQITLARRVIKPGSDKAMCLAAQTSVPISNDEISSVSNLGLALADGTKVALSLSFYNDENAAAAAGPMRGAEPPMHFSQAPAAAVATPVRALPGPRQQFVVYDPARYSKMEQAKESHLGKWLAMTALISVTALYTLVNPKWVPTFIGQAVKISKSVKADLTRRASAPLGATASKSPPAGRAVGGDRPAAQSVGSQTAMQMRGGANMPGVSHASGRHGGHLALLPVSGVGSVGHSQLSRNGARKTFASERDEGRRQSASTHSTTTHSAAKGSQGSQGNALSFANTTMAGGTTPVSTAVPMQFVNQGFSFIAPQMPKAAEAKTSKSSRKGGFMVPPPPPTPCVLPPGFAFFQVPQGQQVQQVQPKQSAQSAPAPGKPRSIAPARDAAPTTNGVSQYTNAAGTGVAEQAYVPNQATVRMNKVQGSGTQVETVAPARQPASSPAQDDPF